MAIGTMRFSLNKLHVIIWQFLTWEECDLRKTLHGIFLKEHFTREERARIVEVTNENPDNPWFKNPKSTNVETVRYVAGGKPTKDKVFLLSLWEVSRYFGDFSKALANPTFMQVGPDKFMSTKNDVQKKIGQKTEHNYTGSDGKPTKATIELLEDIAAVHADQFRISDNNNKTE